MVAGSVELNAAGDRNRVGGENGGWVALAQELGLAGRRCRCTEVRESRSSEFCPVDSDHGGEAAKTSSLAFVDVGQEDVIAAGRIGP